MKTGKIVIKEKVYFEPEGLEKPNSRDYGSHSSVTYQRAMKLYEASKQLVWVEDVFYNDIMGKWLFGAEMKNRLKLALRELVITDNQPCKAEINNNKATIIELL